LKEQQEKSERAARKKALIDINADHTQEGVMDSLFEALQSGSAFSRDQRRRRPGATSGNGGQLYYVFFCTVDNLDYNVKLFQI